MINSDVFSSKGLKCLITGVIASLIINSLTLFPVSAAEAEAVSWSPLKNVTDLAKAPTDTNSEFIWGFYNSASNDGTALSADNYTYDSSSNTAFYTLSGYENIGYMYMLPDGTDKVKASISVEITADYGMKFGFKPTVAGRYYLSEVLGITESDGTVYYRALLESNGKYTALTDTLSGNEGDALNFGGLTAELDAGDTLWLESWSASAATLRIDNPMFTKLNVVANNTENTETVTYDSYDFNLYSNNGENHYSHLVNTDNSNPWKVSIFTISSTNPPDELDYIAADKYDPEYSSGNSKYGIYTKAFGSNAVIRGVSSTKNSVTYTSSLFLKVNYGISYEFTMPQDGYLKFTQTAYLYNSKYRIYKLDAQGNLTVLTDWTRLFNDYGDVINNNLGALDFGEMKKGEKAIFEFCRVGSGTQAYGCQPIAELTAAQKKVLGDANGDNAVDIKDLVHLKQFLSGIIDNINNDDSVIDIEKDGINSTELTVMRRALLGIESHQEYAERVNTAQ